jgi:ketosteroid isomerase-like protein
VTRHEKLTEIFHAVTQGRAAELAELVDPEMVFVSVVAGKEFHGLAGLQEWYVDVAGYYSDASWEILDITEHGDQDSMRWRFQARSLSSGVEFDTEMSQLWSWRDGRACRVEVFPDAEGARSAVRQP